MRILFIRGAFLNRFEGQNYEPLTKNHEIVGIGSLNSIHKDFQFPAKYFFSPYDIFNKTKTRIIRGVFNRILGDSHFLLGFEKFVKNTGRRDIAHIAETHYGYDLQVVNLKKQGYVKKIVSTCWETIPFNNESIGKKKKLKEYVRKNIDYFICPTERARRALIVEGVDEEKIEVVRMGVNLSRFKILNSKFQIPNKSQTQNSTLKTFNILFVGRLVEEKGVIDLYEAFKKVKNINLKLKIIGEGKLENELKRLIRKDRLTNCVLIKKRIYEEMPKVYQEADVLVVPSRTTKTWEEQYGMVLIEAMASGLPIIAYDSGAIPELIKDTGILVKEGDVKALVTAIIRIIENKNLRVRLGKMGREKTEREFDAIKIVEKIEEIYRNTLKYY